ncbi:MAG: hypothetical protein IJU54_00355 [Alphaproteobacteria bacterium]|nr:hypothetical protein [Alphaproteobacteria bacterium]
MLRSQYVVLLSKCLKKYFSKQNSIIITKVFTASRGIRIETIDNKQNV